MLFTTGDIGRKHGVSTQRVIHLVNARRIDPAMVAGGVRLFDESTADRIGHELANMPRPGRPRIKTEPATV